MMLAAAATTAGGEGLEACRRGLRRADKGNRKTRSRILNVGGKAQGTHTE